MIAKPDFQQEHFFPSRSRQTGNVGWHTREITLSMLQEAYWHGIFPWPDGPADRQIPWIRPAVRGLIPLSEFHLPHTVLRQLKKTGCELRIDTAFEEVIRNCADRRNGEDTWITPAIIRAYTEFHRAGWAHSFEIWNRNTGRLAGGLYGVSLGGIFAGESMFYRESGCSKLALAALGLTLKQAGAVLLDTQMVTPTTELFGAAYYDGNSCRMAFETCRGRPLSAEILRSAARRCPELATLC